MLYRTIVRSKLDYGCIVYGTASSANLRQLDSTHNAGLRLALGAFCTSPVSSMYTEAKETPSEERRLKLSMHYYLKTRTCTDNPAHHALHEFDPTTRDLYLSKTHQLTKFGIYINHHILTPLDSCNLFIEHNQLRKPYLRKTANRSLRTCVVVKQMQSNPIHTFKCF